MKRLTPQICFLLCYLVLFLTTIHSVKGQTTVQIGTGTTLPTNTLYGPVYRYSATSTTTAARCNILYTAAEMATAGIPTGAIITQIEFNKGNSANFVTPANYTMYMANTSNTSLATSLTWASVLTTHTSVYSNTSFNIPLAAGWVPWVLTTPYTYTGGALEIASDMTMVGNGGATDKFLWEYTGVSGASASLIVGVASAGATLNGTVADYKNRPNIKITYIGTTPCTSPPNAGTTTVSQNFACPGTGIILNLSGNSIGVGQTYQWQKSNSIGGTYTNIGSSSSSPSFTIYPTVDSFYRCEVVCSSSPATSTPIAVTVNPGLASGTYTINSAVATGGTNFQSFAAAISAMNCGIQGPVVFDVDPASGPYTEQITIPQIIGASATNTVTFNGNGRTIQFAPVAANRHIIKLDGTDYITIKNLNILGTATDYDWGIHLTNAANFDSIVNCTINLSAQTTTTTQSYGAGIVAAASNSTVTTAGNTANNLVVMGCTIIGAYQGIILNGTSATVPTSKNQILNNTIRDFYTNGMEITNNDSIVIANNDIYRSTRVTVTTFAGIELGAGNKRAQVYGNKIHDTHNAATTQSGAAYGIYSNACDAPVDSANTIYNNLFYNFNSGSGTIYALYNSNSDGVHYYHNTVNLDNSTSTAGIARGFFQTALASNIIFKNNNISITRGGTGIKYCVYFGTTTSSILSDFNNLYINSPTSSTSGVGFYSVGYTTLADWKLANSSTYDQSSKNVNPLFTNAAAADFTPNAPLLNDFAPLLPQVPTDILGVTRGSNTDPGAFEYIPGPCSTTIGGDATVSAVLPPCAGNTFTLSLIGNSINTGQTYQWESSSTLGGTYTPVSGILSAAGFQTSATSDMFYRCIVTCSSTSSTSTSTSVEVRVNGLLPAGTYTINPALPSGSGNFQTFASAVNALNCGTTGSVIFTIADGTYTERFDISIWLNNPSDSIVFKSLNGNPALVTITSPSGATALFNSIVGIQKSRNIIFRNITFSRSGTAANSSNIELDSTLGIQFYNNVFVGPTFTATNTTGTQSHIFSNDVNTEDSTIIVGNTFTNNSNGLWFFSNSDKQSRNTVIRNNTFSNSYLSIFLKHHNAVTIENNTIQRNGTGAFDYYGMSLENCDSAATIQRNTIYYNRGYGIRLLGSDGRTGFPNRIFNNMIGADQGTGTALSYGISIESNASYNTAYTDIFHNTIMVNGASTTAGRTINAAGVAASQANNIRIINNILGNTGLGYVYYFPANALSTNNTIDRNNVYTAGTNIGTWNGTIGIPKTQSEWISVSGMDSLSSFVPVNIVSSTNLHLTSTSTTDFNLATDITSLLTTDIDGATRSGTYFVKGAHEASALTLSSIADAGVWSLQGVPSITATGSTLNLTVKIRNNGLVPLTSADIGYSLNGSTMGTFSYTGTLAPGASTNNILIGSISSLPTAVNSIKVWTQNSNGTGDDLNKNNDTVQTSTITSPPLNGSYNVGPSLDFANLTAVANALRTRLITGNVTFQIDQTYTSTGETFPIRFSSPTTSGFPVSIMPSPLATAIVTQGSPASAAQLIVLDSSVGITFDGRAGGAGTASIWTIRNTQTAATYGSVFQFINGAQYDTLRYLQLESQSTNTTNGVIQFSTTTQALGNSNNTVEYCLIRDRSDVTATGPYNAIYSSGTDNFKNTHNTIKDNTIFNFTNNGINVAATGNGDNWIISGNQFYTSASSAIAQTSINFIPADGSSGHTISSNIIGGTTTGAAGTPWVNSGANLFAGIIVNVDSTLKTTVENNIIKNITKTATGAASFAGIRIIKGKVSISGNTIGDPSSANSITNSGTSFTYGIEIQNALGTADTVFVTNNTVANITATGLNANSRIRGISFGFTTNVNPLVYMSDNKVHHLSTTGTATGYAVDLATATGIMVFPSTYKSGSRINNNLVYNIDAAKDTALSTMSIGISASNFAGSIYNNKIYNITNKSTAPIGTTTSIAAGLYARFLSNCVVYNNMISLSDNNHSSVAQLNGILIAGTGGGTHQYSFNSVNIESASGILQSSFAFHRGQNDVSIASAHPIILRNNIFKNSYIGSIGSHYAVGIEDTAVIVTGVSDWNIFKTSDTTKLNRWGASTYNIGSWRSITSNDANSKAVDVDFLNTPIADLHLTGTSIGNTLLAGVPVAGLTKDFDEEIRHAGFPYMGADEILSSPLPVSLADFTATKKRNDVLLYWTIASEVNASHYVIERSNDGKAFSSIGSVKANGNTNTVAKYTYKDAAAPFSKTAVLYYRLKMMDADGKFDYSKTVSVSNIDNTKQLSISVFPNPFNDNVTLSFDSEIAGTITAEVVDLAGKNIAAFTKSIVEGNNSITFNELSDLKAGLYFISIKQGDYKQSIKVIKH